MTDRCQALFCHLIPREKESVANTLLNVHMIISKAMFAFHFNNCFCLSRLASKQCVPFCSSGILYIYRQLFHSVSDVSAFEPFNHLTKNWSQSLHFFFFWPSLPLLLFCDRCLWHFHWALFLNRHRIHTDAHLRGKSRAKKQTKNTVKVLKGSCTG